MFGLLSQLSKHSELSGICVWQVGFFQQGFWYVLLFFRHVADFQLSVASVTEHSSSDSLAQDLHLQAQKLAERVC